MVMFGELVLKLKKFMVDFEKFTAGLENLRKLVIRNDPCYFE